MDARIKIHVGLDVHQDSISVAAAEPGRTPGRLISKVTHDAKKLVKVLVKIGTVSNGTSCTRRAGERIKTDERDSVKLAECSRAGLLSAVWIPDPDDEAIRDLSRTGEDAVNTRVQMRHLLKDFLLRHGVRHTVNVRAWHLELIRLGREHRIHGEHGGCDLGEGGGVCQALAQRRRADRGHSRPSGSRVGAAPRIEPVDLSRQAATGGAATPQCGCSTAWAIG